MLSSRGVPPKDWFSGIEGAAFEVIRKGGAIDAIIPFVIGDGSEPMRVDRASSYSANVSDEIPARSAADPTAKALNLFHIGGLRIRL